jgi:hypothetical protein
MVAKAPSLIVTRPQAVFASPNEWVVLDPDGSLIVHTAATPVANHEEAAAWRVRSQQPHPRPSHQFDCLVVV